MQHGHIDSHYKQRAIHRLRIAQGQLRGLEKMVTDEKYCMDILTQSLAVQKSLKSFDALMLENHLTVHNPTGHTAAHRKKGIAELLALFRLKNNS